MRKLEQNPLNRAPSKQRFASNVQLTNDKLITGNLSIDWDDYECHYCGEGQRQSDKDTISFVNSDGDEVFKELSKTMNALKAEVGSEAAPSKILKRPFTIKLEDPPV
eukprot:COSAG01_NODE_17515_length_1144_cov_1.477512_1_plen_106_part_10